MEISQQQLKEVRTEEKHRTKGGASSDTVFADLGGGVSTFLVAGAATVRHRKNAFEDGYHATLPSVTVGADYRVNTQLAVGLAFHYFNWDGDFTSAGGFNVHSYAPLGYLNYAPFDRAFVDVVLGYARQNVSYSRLVQIVKDPDRGGTDSRYLVSADFHSQVLSAHLQTGYDFTVSPNDTFTIGPRLGLNVQHALLDDYQESSNTGLELRYRVPDQSAVQTSLGFKTAWALATSIGTVSPSVAVHWVHEFANGQRTLHAGFIHDPASQEFAFKTETPARDWARLDLGVSVLLSPQFLVFATASTVQGNANLESYGGTVGVRANC